MGRLAYDISIKNLVCKEKLVKKLTQKYMRSYVVEKIVSRNTMKLTLLASVRIHPVVNVSRVVRYKEPVKK